MIDVQFMKLHPEAIMPTRAYEHDAGIDLTVLEDTVIGRDEAFVDVRSGLAMALPPGYYARLVARSSALRKWGVRVNEGTIDAGYRGELFTSVTSAEGTTEVLPRGVSVCQIIVQPVVELAVVQVSDLPESVRGTRGFGSSDERRAL